MFRLGSWFFVRPSTANPRLADGSSPALHRRIPNPYKQTKKRETDTARSLPLPNYQLSASQESQQSSIKYIVSQR